jgi:hypothetical protein
MVARKTQEFRFIFVPLRNGGDDNYMTVLDKGWAGAKPTTGSSYGALELNARKTPLLAVTLQLDDITVSANHKENTVPSVSLNITRVTVATLTWCLLCCNLVTVITRVPLFRLSAVISRNFEGKFHMHLSSLHYHYINN